jgi:hypothetical protein
MVRSTDRSTAKHDDADIQNEVQSIGGIKFLNAEQNELIAYTGKKLEAIYDSSIGYGPLHILPVDPYIFNLLRHSKLYKKIADETFLNLPAAKGMIGLSHIYAGKGFHDFHHWIQPWSSR